LTPSSSLQLALEPADTVFATLLVKQSDGQLRL